MEVKTMNDKAAGKGTVLAETTSLCPKCAGEASARYVEEDGGVIQYIECDEHGMQSEKVENDADFFMSIYEKEYDARKGHLVFPITYRCNMNCRYCYTLSNSGLECPPDRPASRIIDFAMRFGESTNLIGGEPTVREDLFEIIRGIRELDSKRVLSLSTNGQKLADWDYVKALKDSGLDFIFFPINHPDYEPSPASLRNKHKALENCLKAGIPIWLQRTVDSLYQIDDLYEIVRKYRKIIFDITVRSVKPYGVKHPSEFVHVSDMVNYLGKEGRWSKGSTPFNCHIRFAGKKTKLCSWVNDVGRLDPIDFAYIVSNDEVTTFHRGMMQDEVLIKTGGWKKG